MAAKLVAQRAREAAAARRGPIKLVPANPDRAVKYTGSRKIAVRMNSKAAPEVRPLGVLPPEAIARAREKPPAPAARVAVKTPEPPRPAAKSAVRKTTESKGDQGVTEQDLKYFEERLMVERQKIQKEMGHLENTVLKVNQRDSSGDLSGYSFHMADAGTDAMEREKAFLFASAEGRLLIEINEALRRIYNREYGNCEKCGEPISRVRLEAHPHARLCLACQEKEERASRGAP